MKDLAVITLLPVLPVDLVGEGPMDELQDRLIPVQEDELPQGVLELMAALVLRPVVAVVEHDSAGQPTQNRPADLRLPQAVVPVASVIDKVVAQPLLIEPVSSPVEVLPDVPTVRFEGQRSEALYERPAPTNAPFAAPVKAPPSSPQIPHTVIETIIEAIPETRPDSARNLLQVPFNKGLVSGQVTISRVSDEPVRNLQLSPSNTQVFEHLKVSLEQVREPTWRLTDNRDEQQRQGSRQAPDDEQNDDA
ncbi:invasion protein [Pseudomonas sp. REP124]|uniref:SpaN/EivJ family type III secretion system needle length determinant n=1 Tax=Pseudomonas sp. REP124 TaxID=2875731 RepID=UPI001CCBAFDE|nr:invasion protein [Pseudomonas sp. REP124]MBZ9781935.1 invasion protein [Pseudomonas sp. REP124]